MRERRVEEGVEEGIEEGVDSLHPFHLYLTTHLGFSYKPSYHHAWFTLFWNQIFPLKNNY